MKKILFLFFGLVVQMHTFAQCAMCTKTAAGLDEGSAEGLNKGIIFLALTPLTIILILGITWYRRNKHEFVS